jgi:hypothetical protein
MTNFEKFMHFVALYLTCMNLDPLGNQRHLQAARDLRTKVPFLDYYFSKTPDWEEMAFEFVLYRLQRVTEPPKWLPIEEPV